MVSARRDRIGKAVITAIFAAGIASVGYKAFKSDPPPEPNWFCFETDAADLDPCLRTKADCETTIDILRNKVDPISTGPCRPFTYAWIGKNSGTESVYASQRVCESLAIGCRRSR